MRQAQAARWWNEWSWSAIRARTGVRNGRAKGTYPSSAAVVCRNFLRICIDAATREAHDGGCDAQGATLSPIAMQQEGVKYKWGLFKGIRG
ncbi:protein of unknown function [Pararobbsia alpina]